MNNCFFISEGVFTFKVEGTGFITRGFFVSGGSEVIIVVSINETIDIIINNIYNNPYLPPLKINPNIFRKLLLTCTTEVPFYDHLGNIYVQTDGVSMGSVLGPIFSNFYMSDLENRIFNSIKKPSIYLRYVDDILILTNNINKINILQDTFQNNSVLNVTHELNKNNKISFLDVLIDTNNNSKYRITFKNKRHQLQRQRCPYTVVIC